jgi:hypothetical protein
MSSVHVPIVVAAVAFLAFAVVDWKRLPVCGRISLGVSTAFFLAAFQYPGLSIQEIVDSQQDGLAFVVAAGRVLGLGTVLISLSLFVRRSVDPE